MGDGRPRQRCPICGISQLVATLPSHVGSARCSQKAMANKEKWADPVHGPKIFRMVQKLRKALGEAADDADE